LDWQLGWGDLNLLLIAAVLFGSVLSLWGIKGYAEQFVGDELASLQREGVLYELANFDCLTGLANRSRLMDFLEGAVARARRQDTQFALLFIDLDGFKAVNDRLGHSRGDRILVESARRLQQHLREDELMARYGGDEFIWVTDSAPETPVVADMIRRLRQEFEPPFRIDGQSVNVGVSVGYSIYPRDGRNVAALIDVADSAMYRDKRRQEAGNVTPPL
jgi:diguanylate cyclase (GGDEF)-like protein